MLFLLALPVISCVGLFWRYLQIYAPSNLVVRRVRSAPPRWRTVPALLALAAALLLAMHVVSQAVAHGAAGWLNPLVLVLAWDAVKFFVLALIVAVRCVGAVLLRGRMHASEVGPRLDAEAQNACVEVDRIYTEAFQAYARQHPQWRDEEIAAARVAGQEAAKAYIDTLPREVGRLIGLPNFLPLAVS